MTGEKMSAIDQFHRLFEYVFLFMKENIYEMN